MLFSELNETIEPYVLKEVPSVISVGDRTMNKGRPYIWKAGCYPYLITPEENNITFEVIRDIPYLRKNSDLCQPHDATDEDFRFDAIPSRERVAADDNVDVAQPSEGGSENPPPVRFSLRTFRTSWRNLIPEGISERRLLFLNHLLTHKPFNIHCDACNLGKDA